MRRRFGDRGETSIETVLLFPIVLMILFAGVHVGALSRAGQVAGVAAFRGAQIAAAGDGSAVDRVTTLEEIDRVIVELGAHASSAPRIQVGERSVAVSVSVDVERIVPFLPVSATRRVNMAREVFIKENDR